MSFQVGDFVNGDILSDDPKAVFPLSESFWLTRKSTFASQFLYHLSQRRESLKYQQMLSQLLGVLLISQVMLSLMGV